MSAAWNAGLTRSVTTADGQNVSIIFPGNWSHGSGPDFSDAMMDFSVDGYCTGAVEIHTRASDWIAHGHHLDERYNSVVLHIVTIDDLDATRRADGKVVPKAILQISDDILFAIDRRLPEIWSELGGSVCAADLSAREPARIRTAIQRLGDVRLAARVTAIGSELALHPPAGVLLTHLFDGFGYSENRGPMRQLAETLARYGFPEHPSIIRAGAPSPQLVGLMLGISGFLPLAPTDAHAGGILPEDQYIIERHWFSSPAAIADDIIPATAWHMGRVRPANHPVARIIQAATLLTKTGGSPHTVLLDAIRDDEPLIDVLKDMTLRTGHPGIGTGRATAMIASAVLPFALAWAAHDGDTALEDSASRLWASLKLVEWTRPAKRARNQVTGGPSVRGLGERGHQGLLHLDRELCTLRKCFQCPIAAEVIRDRASNT